MALALSFASGHDTLTVRHFDVGEALSTLFDVSVVAMSHLEDIDFETLVGQKASFTVTLEGVVGHSPPRGWHGICSHFEQIQAEETGLSTYLVRIVPELWLLGHRQNHRVFQHLSIPGIAKKLLGEWKIEPVFEIDPHAYPEQDYRVQHGESDLAFLTRLLEEAGITYRFRYHPERGTDLVLADTPHTTKARSGGAIPFHGAPSANARTPFVTRVSVHRAMKPGAHVVRDFDFRGRVDLPLESTGAKVEGPEARLEQYHYHPGSIVRENPDALAAIAARRLESDRAMREVVRFETNVLDLEPGTVFAMRGHPRAALDEKNTHLVHELAIQGSATGSLTIAGKATPTRIPHRPERKTPRPSISGLQSALVTGPKGEEVHTDEHGRVRVQFHWDREGKHDEQSSCWVRVNQGWAGSGYGMITLPRVGQEVTVGFFEGDPDQPIILGRAYNGVNRVPYKLPENKTRSGWKSQSVPSNGDDGAFNELLFEDKKDEELVAIQAQRDMHKLVKGNELERIGADLTLTVGKSRTATVGKVDATLVGERHTVSITPAGGGEPTRIDMSDRHIVCTTGEASVTFDGPNLALEAKGNITITAHDGDVVIKGGPNVKINCE